MTDQRLRQLARAAQATQDPSAEAALLRERLRAGALHPEGLALAAYCGHPPALAVVPRPLGAPSDCGLCHGHPDGILVEGTRVPCWHDLAPWVRGLGRWGEQALRRASVAAAQVALPAWCDSTRLSGRVGLHELREAQEGVCRRCTWGDGSGRPGDAVRAAVLWLGGAKPPTGDSYELERKWDEAWAAASRAHELDWLVWIPAPIAAPDRRASEIAGSALLAGVGPVRTAMERALIAWALA